jgi:hypothetical protein
VSASGPGLLYCLDYELLTDGWAIDFENPPAVKLTEPTFEATLEAGRLVVETVARYPNEGEARRAVEPVLRAWEIAVLLGEGTDAAFSFAFRQARAIDRETSGSRPPGGVRVSQVAVEVLVSKPPARTSYPVPPADFVANDLVLRMWRRWQAYRAGKEGLSSVANYCLTELEKAAPPGPGGGRDRAALWLNVAKPILRCVGQLAATRGTEADARKAGAVRYAWPERAWLETTVPLLIRRAGEVAARVQRPQLTMGDLPPLP